MAIVGDCAACHTDPHHGKPFAGGYALETPFGKLLASNITSDKNTGIGAWSEQEFTRAVREGKGRHGDAVTYRAHGSFSANSVEAVRTASKQNLGLAMLTYGDIRNELAEGSLALVTLADAVPAQLSITAVLATRQHVPRRVRVFVEHLEQALNR